MLLICNKAYVDFGEFVQLFSLINKLKSSGWRNWYVNFGSAVTDWVRIFK